MGDVEKDEDGSVTVKPDRASSGTASIREKLKKKLYGFRK